MLFNTPAVRFESLLWPLADGKGGTQGGLMPPPAQPRCI
jgi:hypothetical protein